MKRPVTYSLPEAIYGWRPIRRRFQIDYRPNRTVRAIVTELLRSEYLKELLDLAGQHKPKVVWSRLPGTTLARYLSGSAPMAVFIIDSHKVARTARECDAPIVWGTESTVLHELGHAIMDDLGLAPGDAESEEELAETFGRAAADRRDTGVVMDSLRR